ncbi:DUF2231 domain-containing protein [Aestuariibaculum sediminum]|uniref:Cytochrome c domain-containing protein n=1 Tax=Aestuariibaculum sediminum TaxID=2770637 RepID=A0A8J6Q5P4_9FLAO|nr:DUF2231 domain-containing protein [Aestuariibaculum sediminum]MBD0830913.1 hypothetical protein [Aestuariibaculum sediminum]
MTFLLESNLYQFFGRFHAMIVHLPIGFISLALLFEIVSLKQKVELKPAISYAYFAGAISGIVAIILGLMLASGGGYNESTLNIHKWTAIAMTCISLLLFFIKRYQGKVYWVKRSYLFFVIAVTSLMFIAGHNGGNLTHGSTYLLEYAPTPIRTLAGLKPERKRITNLDSALVYQDVISVVFDAKCNVCHNADKSKGDLLLTTPENILKGGKNGIVLVAGDAENSELFRRITLDPEHKEFMPTEGRTPLTKEEVQLVAWWINEGLSFDKKLTDLNLTDRIKSSLQTVGIGLKKSFVESLDLAEIDNKIIEDIRAAGFKIKTVANNSNLLEVSYSVYNPEPISEEKMNQLLHARSNIIWINFSNIDLSPQVVSKLGQFENLTQLKIQNTNLDDEGLKALESLKHLEYLNVYGDAITDAGIESIKRLPALKKLYVWKTKLTPKGINRLTNELNGVEVFSGLE